VGYELGIFYDSGGLVWIPFHAATVGVIAGFWTGYRRNGLFFGWVLSYVSLLSWRAEWATEISARTLAERIGYIVRLDGLVVLALIGIIVALLGFMAGEIVRKGVDTVRVGH
jgi:hypothetical protein